VDRQLDPRDVVDKLLSLKSNRSGKGLIFNLTKSVRSRAIVSLYSYIHRFWFHSHFRYAPFVLEVTKSTA